MSAKPGPAMERDSTEWWERLSQHELALQRCDGCQLWRWPARAICNGCGSFEWSWAPASGKGTIASWIVNHHSFSDAFTSPYVVLAVRLDEQDDIVMYGSWAGAPDGTDLAVGMPVTVEFEDVAAPDADDDGFSLLRWRAAP